MTSAEPGIGHLAYLPGPVRRQLLSAVATPTTQDSFFWQWDDDGPSRQEIGGLRLTTERFAAFHASRALQAGDRTPAAMARRPWTVTVVTARIRSPHETQRSELT